MARQDIERPVQQSLLDRLIDFEPRNAAERPLTRSESVRALKDSLKRDVEWLLNTRANAEKLEEGLDRTAESVLFFGLPDVSSLSADSAEDRVRLLSMIGRAIAVHEPRLENVNVSEGVARGGDARQMHFIVQALLRMDPAPEQIYFDTVLDLSSGQYEVKGE